MDWAELLIEGDEVEYELRSVSLDDGTTLTYYEVKPLEKITTPVEGQADVIVMEVTPVYDNEEQAGDVVSWTWSQVDKERTDYPAPPDFEAVYLKLKEDQNTPELVKTIGIVNDCTALRVRGVFIREDIKGRRYPMMFELPTLRAGGAVRSKEISCYKKTEEDDCEKVYYQPEMELVRINDWRLALSPNVCVK